MVIGPTQPLPNPELNPGWFDSASSSLMALGQRFVMPVLETTGVVSYLCINTLYQKCWQGKSMVAATGEALFNHMPKIGSYKAEIQKQQKEIERKSGGPYCNELCQKIANLTLQRIKEWVINAPAYDSPLQKPIAKYFVTAKAENKSELNFCGELFKYVIENREGLVQDAVEVNVLKGFNNILDFIKKCQEENPFLLVELVKDLLDEVLLQINTLEKGPEANKEEISTELFAKAVAKKLLSIAFPRKAEDLINPMPDFISSSNLYKILEERALPKRLEKSFLKALDQDRANLALLKGLKRAREILSGQKAVQFPSKAEMSSSVVGYAKQDEFNKSLSEAMSAIVTFLDPSLHGFLTRFMKFPKLAKLVGPSLVKKLAKVNLVENVNQVAKALLPLIKLPLHPKTMEEAKNEQLASARRNQEIRIELEREMTHLTEDISGVPVLAKDYLRAKAKAKRNTHLHSSLKYYCKLLLIDLEIVALKIGISVLGVRRQLNKTTNAAYQCLKGFTIKEALKPLTSLIFKKM